MPNVGKFCHCNLNTRVHVKRPPPGGPGLLHVHRIIYIYKGVVCLCVCPELFLKITSNMAVGSIRSPPLGRPYGCFTYIFSPTPFIMSLFGNDPLYCHFLQFTPSYVTFCILPPPMSLFAFDHLQCNFLHLTPKM